jgi:hypothetical protein
MWYIGEVQKRLDRHIRRRVNGKNIHQDMFQAPGRPLPSPVQLKIE